MSDAREKYNSPLASRLRALIDAKHTTITAVAEYIKMTRQSVSQYCAGSTQTNAEAIVKMANFFNVSTDYLLGLSPNPTIDKERPPFATTLVYHNLSERGMKRKWRKN